MKINYKSRYISQNINIKKLRPGNSYGSLVKNKNKSFSFLLKKNQRIKKKLKLRNCPNCKSHNYKKILLKDKLKIVKCAKCELIYVNPIFNFEDYFNTYKSKNYQKIMKSLGEKSHLYRLNRFGKERYEYLKKKVLKKKINLLDVGCSTGFFIEYANSKGWKCEGLELNPSAAIFGEKRKLKIFQKTLEEHKPKKKYDIVTMFDVLEHLPNPGQEINVVKKILNNKGLLYVYVPNWQSATRILMGEKNSHFIWPTHHLTYFTPNTLINFFSRRGFNILDWETQGLDLYDYKWFLDNKNKKNNFTTKQIDILQFYINSSGHGKNLRMLFQKR